MNVGYKKKRKQSITISPPTSVMKKKKPFTKRSNRSNPQSTPTKDKHPKEKDPHVIDLTTFTHEEELLPGTPLEVIKNQHSLFYRYDPRGYKPKKKLPSGYCLHCRCPNSYCAEQIFGKMCAGHGYSILLENGCHKEFDSSDVRFFYQKAYTAAVSSKMRWNKISFGCEHTTMTLFDVPECIKRGSLRYLQLEFQRDKKLEANYPDHADLDIEVDGSEEEEDI